MIKVVCVKIFGIKILKEVNHLLGQIGLTAVSPRPLTSLVFKELLSQENVYFLMAQGNSNKGQRFVGMLVLYFVRVPSGLYAVLEDLVVDSGYRKWGVGRLLVEKAVELAKKKRARHLSLRTSSQRLEANKLYQQMGFFRMKTNFYRVNLFR